MLLEAIGGYISDFFCGENLPFCYSKKAPGNMFKAIFWKISKKITTFGGRKL
jgi:hypothetical protein